MSEYIIEVFKASIPIQLILLPLLIYNIVIRRSNVKIKGVWKYHKLLLFLLIFMPLLIPFKRFDIDSFKQISGTTYEQNSNITELYSSINPNELFLDQYKSIFNRSIIVNNLNNNKEKTFVAHLFSRISLSNIVKVLFIIGFFNLITALVRNQVMLIRLIKNSDREIYKGIEIYKTDFISSGLSHGYFKHRIFLNRNLSLKQKNIVFNHECNHIKLNHLLCTNIEFCLKKLFWFNPMFYFVSKEGQLIREYLCDNLTVQSINPIDYGNTLLELSSTKGFNLNLAGAHCSEKENLKSRIENIVMKNIKERSLKTKITGSVMGVVILTSLVLLPINLFSNESDKKSSLDKVSSYEFDVDDVHMEISYSDKDNLQLSQPLEDYRITLGFGQSVNVFTGEEFFHTGSDLAYKENVDVFATGGGKVIYVGNDPESLGEFVVIQHKDELFTVYAHLNAVNVNINDKVDSGSIIGKLGNTGRSTGPHLHYEIRYSITPERLIELLTSDSANDEENIKTSLNFIDYTIHNSDQK